MPLHALVKLLKYVASRWVGSTPPRSLDRTGPHVLLPMAEGRGYPNNAIVEVQANDAGGMCSCSGCWMMLGACGMCSCSGCWMMLGACVHVVVVG